MFLSNIDQHVNMNMRTLYFFTWNPDFSAELAVERLKGAVIESLGPFSFLAGRLKWNADLQRLEIDCSDPVGVGFVVAKSECALEEIGDLTYPHPAFEQLVALDMKRGDDKILMIIQVTTFRCGSFSMGITQNHVTMDGISLKIYLQNLAAWAANKPLTLTPCHDRHLLAARSPPRTIPLHGNSFRPRKLIDLSDQPNPLAVMVFKLSALDIAKLKHKIMKSYESNEDTKEGSKHIVSQFNVITALVWKCKALINSTLSSTQNQDRVSKLHYAVNIRNRLHPLLPQSYIGNALCYAYGTPSTFERLKSCSLREVVEWVAEGSMRITDEYVRRVIDSYKNGDSEKGLYGECVVTNWCNIGLERVEYPWGRPKYYCPLDYRRKDSVVMFPSMQHEVGSLNGTDNRGVNLFVTQSGSEEMSMFERHFNELLREYDTVVTSCRL
uniref:Uncharacterized protein n=1 Tax=Kalanchoe fedtschenkoi TaxID=63787 RepID=A0A7N0TPD4_KALFE